MNKKMLIFILIIISFLLIFTSCQTKKSEVKQEQKVEEQKKEEPNKEEAKKLLDEVKSIIVKTEELGATDQDTSYKEAKEVYQEALKYFNEGNMQKFNEVITKARTKAEFAYNEIGKAKTAELSKKLEEEKKKIEDYKDVKNFSLEFKEIEELTKKAKMYEEKKDYANAIVSYQEAINKANQIYNTMESYKNYVMLKYGEVLALNDEIFELQSYLYLKEDYDKFKNLLRSLEDSIRKNDYITAKDLIDSAVVLGNSLKQATKDKLLLIQDIEAQRYLFETKVLLDNLAMEEKGFSSEEKELFKDLLNKYQLAENFYKEKKFIDTINICKEILMKSVKFFGTIERKGKYYTVKLNPARRDCLWRIAEYFYKNPFLWPLIWIANIDKISNPDLIFPGQVFLIPELSSD
ncbi:MAG: LysM peptidoglycan-binding domain-containing protein [Spirochaetes bacterium]|nr:LysM peptidoglycan-binding domain-containing protein [Spirochaetota bacterium]